jgi:hypothetical protein
LAKICAKDATSDSLKELPEAIDAAS